MSILMAAILAVGANDEHDLDLATALARRGWVELAEDVIGRIDKNHAGLHSATGSGRYTAKDSPA